jgi:phage terminase large subunit
MAMENDERLLITQSEKLMIFNLPVSPVFLANYKALLSTLYFIIVNQGGSRSGKTYSILQLILLYSLSNKGKIIDIVRKTHAELRDTVLTDWNEILEAQGCKAWFKENKTHYEYRINGNVIRFLGMDKAQKKRGSKRHILYINEANGLTLEDWTQLKMRTIEKIWVDFNPSEYFWINEHVLDRPFSDGRFIQGKEDNRFKLIRSTYKDNIDFLPHNIVKSIEDLIHIDDFYYQVYALGNLAVMKGKIYNNYKTISLEEYEMIDYDFRCYGIDWGYEHPACLMEMKYAREGVYTRCLYLESHKSDDEFIQWMVDAGISMTDDIFADPAYPASIRKAREAGFSVHKAKKDIQDSIRFLQSLKSWHVVYEEQDNATKSHKRSLDRYKWKQTSDGKIVTGEPVKIDDDPCDAERYVVYNALRQVA